MTRTQVNEIKQEYRFCSVVDTLNSVRDSLTAHVRGVKVDFGEVRNLVDSALKELGNIRNAEEEMRFDFVNRVAHD